MTHSSRILVFLAVLAGGVRIFASCPSVQWTPQNEYAAALSTRSTLLIDYDEDGVLDLITAESPSGSDNPIYSRRGVGDLTFEAPVTLAANTFSPLAAADVTGDGHVDLIFGVANGIMILPGTGSGFAAQQLHSVDYTASGLVAGNYDADPAMEIVASSVNSHLFVFYDTQGGQLVETQRVSTGDFPRSVGVADFDADGHYDVVIPRSGSVSIYFRNASGTFEAPVTMPLGTQPQQLAIGDLDSDGKLDFAVNHSSAPPTIRIYRNAGSRQFTETSLALEHPTGPATNGSGTGLLMTDLDADGHLDLLASRVNSSYGIATFAGIGDGTFRTPTWSSHNGVSSMAVGDLNDDGVLDLVAHPYSKHVVFSRSCATQVYAVARPRTISVGQVAEIEIVISGFGGAMPASLGTVSIGSTTADVDVNGRASLQVPSLPLGDNILTVDFSGNSTVPAGTSLPITVTVTTQTTTTKMSTNGASPVYGTPWPVLVALTSSTGHPLTLYTLEVDGVGTPHSTNEGIVQLLLSPGPHTIRARYEGSDTQPPSESPLLSVTTQKASPLVAQTGALAVRAGTAHALQFQYSGSPETETPTGTLQLFEGTSLLAAAQLVNGSASVSLPVLSRGAHNVRAVYSGDANFESTTSDLTLVVLPNLPFVIEARALPAGFHVSFVLPPDTSSFELYRRVAGTADWTWVSFWNPVTGMDHNVLPRGVVYEYRIELWLTNGTPVASNIDSAILFTDDLLPIGGPIKRTHFVELRQAVNLMRGVASLPPFEFEAGFGTSPIVRASHINGLRTALNQARSALGMTTLTFAPATPGSTQILASDVQNLRELAR